MPKSAVGVLLSVLVGVPVFSQQPSPAAAQATSPSPNPTGALRQIIPGHYLYSVTTFNSGIVATGDGVVVLDALSSDAIARAQRDSIASTIRQPIRFLVSSTFHNQYSKGNTAYAGAVKIGHELYRTDLISLTPTGSARRYRPRSRRRDCPIRHSETA